MSGKTNQCRVCLENVKNFKQFTDDFTQDTDFNYEPRLETISSAFEFCTKLIISEFDNESFLCLSCTKNLRFSYDFIRQAIKADSSFHKIVNSSDDIENEDFRSEENQECVKLEDAYMLIEEVKSAKEQPQIQSDEEVDHPDSPESSAQDIIDEEYIMQNEEAVEEEYILEMNEDNSLEPIVVDNFMEVTTADKRLLKNKKYVSRKDIPANFSCSDCCKF